MAVYKYFAAIIDGGQVSGIPNQSSTADNLLLDIMNIVYFAAGIVAVFAIIIAGFLYVTSAGDPGKAKTAKNAILYAVIGLVAVILSFIITAYIRTSVA